MTLVDTTVWIDFLAGADLPHVAELERLLSEGEDICVCGVILTEVLQGIRDEREFRRTKARFADLVFLPMTRPTFERSAVIYRRLRREGVTVRNSVDCMIAAVAIEHGTPLLHNDRDFDKIEERCGLRVVKALANHDDSPGRRTGRTSREANSREGEA